MVIAVPVKYSALICLATSIIPFSASQLATNKTLAVKKTAATNPKTITFLIPSVIALLTFWPNDGQLKYSAFSRRAQIFSLITR